MRGSTTLNSLSRNTYIRSPRSVTLAPMFIPSRSLNAAMDFFALVMTGFWPLMVVSSSTAFSSAFEFWIASPTDMLMTTFSSFGTIIGFLYSNRSFSLGTTSDWYFSLSLAAMTIVPCSGRAAVRPTCRRVPWCRRADGRAARGWEDRSSDR